MPRWDVHAAFVKLVEGAVPLSLVAILHCSGHLMLSAGGGSGG